MEYRQKTTFYLEEGTSGLKEG